MKKLLHPTVLSLVFSLALVACTVKPVQIISEVTPTPNHPLALLTDFQKGVVYTSWWHGEYSGQTSDITLSGTIKPLGVNWISVIVTCYQETITSVDIQCKPDTKTPTDDDLVHVIQYAHQIGLRVMLKPHIDINNDAEHWRGQIGFGNDDAAWGMWFANYTSFIVHYAQLAQINNVDYFVVGTELVETTGRETQWRSVISKVRTIYKGPLTYAANWGNVFDIKWWDALGTIGVDAYYPLTEINQPTVAQLRDAWAPIVGQLRQLSKTWERPIIITEIGYRSLNGTNKHSFDGVDMSNIDLQEQADCYQAFFEAFNEQPWWHGVFWWNWSIEPTQGGPLDTNYTANNKPAENILRLHYGALPRNIPTPNSVAR
jgi:hypothetical protein